MKTCPFFGVCGGCIYDFTVPDYREKKIQELKNLPLTDKPIWISPGTRRRADFAFTDDVFGFFQHKSKKIVPITNCPLLLPEINKILPKLAKLPWKASGACLVTLCDNGIDISITSAVPYFPKEFKSAVDKIENVIKVTWNNQTVIQKEIPTITFDKKTISFPAGAFLQPTITSEKLLRDLVINAATKSQHIADLFCGLGTFTFSLNAEGFDINGIGKKRDLFKNPLTNKNLEKYDCVIMDPPRAGALEQCKELAKSTVSRIIYISCNPLTWQRDAKVLEKANYKLINLTPIDQFVGSIHWELFSIFDL